MRSQRRGSSMARGAAGLTLAAALATTATGCLSYRAMTAYPDPKVSGGLAAAEVGGGVVLGLTDPGLGGNRAVAVAVGIGGVFLFDAVVAAAYYVGKHL